MWDRAKDMVNESFMKKYFNWNEIIVIKLWSRFSLLNIAILSVTCYKMFVFWLLEWLIEFN